jgi:ubiquinone/menaquinone biosynthesis C-methylase UbiE
VSTKPFWARALRRTPATPLASDSAPPEDRSARHDPDEQWFWDHYGDAVEQIVTFCEPRGATLRGREVADIGCGDGIMATGLCNRTSPSRLVGFDIVPTNRELLAERCRQRGVGELPAALEFRDSAEMQLPAPDAAFDFVYSWSAFEHVSKPVEMLTEIRRIVRPAGHFFLQLWPFYLSPNGSHLWEWFPEPHHHLIQDHAEIVARMRASDRHDSGWTEYMIREFEHLNRITLEDLRRDLAASGFRVTAFEFITGPTDVAPELTDYSWADLAVGGIKLLATPT